jgi:acetate kinase
MINILTLNCGSATIKFAIFKQENNCLIKTHTGIVDQIQSHGHLLVKDTSNKILMEKKLEITKQKDSQYSIAFQAIYQWLQTLDINITAVGHRVIHGGTKYRNSITLNPEIIKFLQTFNHLAPLHQPFNLEGVKFFHQHYPKTLQVCCFDTAFHTTCEPLSQLFAIPQDLTASGIRRYGFHGLSYQAVVSKFEQYLPKNIVNGKIIIAHLGQGASMCAVKNRQSLAVSIGFSALDGLPMGTRCGSIDAGVLLHLMSHHKLSYKEIEELLYKKSGLLGVSGISSDMRILLASDHPDAKIAIDLFAYHIAKWIGTLTAELGGLDGLVFTAGIGENAAAIREQVCARAAWLGAKIDNLQNQKHAATISSKDSKISIHVIATDEEKVIAEDTWRVWQGSNC